MDELAEKQRVKMKTDLNYRPIQKSIKDMIKVRESSSNDRKQVETVEENLGSVVKKKVIEIDTKAEKDKYSELI